MSSAATPADGRHARPPETLAERFWSLARGMDPGDPDGEPDPAKVVRHVLAVLDALAQGRTAGDVTVNTLSFLALLRQQEVKGDLLYASPEQARGEAMDERSLVFSVGVLLFEKLTGRHPFGADGNPQRIARIRRGEIASGVNYFPKVPSRLRSVLVRAMGPFPEERWGTLLDLRAQLEQFAGAPDPDEVTAIRESLPAVPAVSDTAATRVAPGPRATVSGQTRRRRTSPPPVPPGRRPPSVIVEPSLAPSVIIDTTPRPPSPIRVTPSHSMAAAVARARHGSASQPADAMPRPFAPAPTEQIPRLATSLRRRAAWVQPATYMGAGALLATAAFVVLSGGGPPATASAAAFPPPVASAAVATTPLPDDQPAPAAAPGPRGVTSPSAAAAAITAAAEARVAAPAATPPIAAEAAAPAEFDVELAGENALAAARPCFDEERLASGVPLGVSLVFGARDGLSSKVYFGAEVDLSQLERRCLLQALVGVSAGTPLPGNTVGVFTMYLAAFDGTVRGYVE